MNTCKLLALAAVAALGSGTATAEQDADGGSHIVRNGLSVDFQIKPLDGRTVPVANELAEVRFRIHDSATGKPVPGANPGAWMDMSQVLQGKTGAQQKSCKEKISLYMQGTVGIRPMVDLNSYFVLVMNAGPTVTVIDPLVSMAGSTSTLANLQLPSPGADWARSADQKRLYVSSPRAGKVTVIDAEAFSVVKHIPAGKEPLRTALQPDGRYLWVGNDAKDATDSGVTVIDTETEAVVARIATGRGHHEIAFSADSRLAFVSNRDEGTVSVIDVAKRAKTKDLKTGPLPISLGYSAAAKALYVADGKDGAVWVFGGETLEKQARIELKSGLGPLRFAPDGRHLLVANPSANAVFVIDAAANELVHTVDIKGEPFQIAFSKAFAYVRSLRSERVAMIALPTLEKGRKPTVQYFAAGAKPPADGGQLVIADSIAAGNTDANVFVVNPADNSTYFYMEGMNAPSTNYAARGGSARAVTLVDRSLKEVEPGVYAGKVRVPAAGRYDVAFTMQTPQLLHCFSAQVDPNPVASAPKQPLRVQFDDKYRVVTAGETATLRFRLLDGATGQPRTGVADGRVLSFLAPGRNRTETALKEVGGGEYEFSLPAKASGAYYVYLAVPSLKMDYGALSYFTVMSRPAATATTQVKTPGG